MNSTAARLLGLFRLYPDYFNYYLSLYYPFTKEEIEKYKSRLNWIDLSGNVFLDWNEDLLLSFKELWDWGMISLNTFGVKGLSSPFLLKKHIDNGLLEETLLIYNENIEWTKDIVIENGLENEFMNEKICNLFKWDFSKVKEAMEQFPDIHTLSINAEVEWTDEIIDKYIDEIDFSTHGSDFRAINEGGYPWQYKYEIKVKTKPKEVEEILSLLEKYGDRLISRPCKNDDNYQHRDYFMFNNPLKNGIDFTFNTEEKKAELNIAVKHFYSNNY